MMIVIAPNGQRFGQIPQPMHSCSEMKAMRDSGVTLGRLVNSYNLLDRRRQIQVIPQSTKSIVSLRTLYKQEGEREPTYTKLAGPHNGARFLALLTAFLFLSAPSSGLSGSCSSFFAPSVCTIYTQNVSTGPFSCALSRGGRSRFAGRPYLVATDDSDTVRNKS